MVGSLFLTSVATASEAGEVVSTNIVGYDKFESASTGGFTSFTSPFVSVLSTNQMFTLRQLTGNFRTNQSIQFFDSNGNVYFRALYMFGDWEDTNEEIVNDVPIPAGTGMFLSTGVNPFDGFIAGQVEQEDITIELAQNGFTFIGNASPVPLKLSEFTFTGLRTNNSLQFFDKDGNVYFRALYMFGDWENINEEVINDYEVQPGDGFFVSCGLPAAGFTKIHVTIPTAFPTE